MKKHRVLAVLLAAVTVFTSVPVYATTGEDPLASNRVMQLDFENSVADSIKTTRATAMKKWVDNESVDAGENTDYAYVDGVIGEKALQLNGGAYLSLGTDADLNPSSMTFSMWINPQEAMTGEHILVWNKNQYFESGWYISSFDNDLAISIGSNPSGGAYEVHYGMTRSEFFPVGEWTHLAVTFDETTKVVAIYRNGVLQSSSTLTQDESGKIEDSGVDKAIGYNGPAYKGGYLKAQLDHVVLLNTAADATSVIELYQEGRSLDRLALAQEDADALALPATTKRDMNLPTVGSVNASTITWVSNNTDVIANDGTVTTQSEEVTVTLTATITNGTGDEAKSVTKTFDVVVKVPGQVYLYNNEMDKVTLEDDYLVNAENKDVEYLLSMNSNKFLYEFYKVAGLTPLTDEGYAGWERSNDANFRGHFFGHYMSSLSQAYLGCKDAETKAALLSEIKDAVNGLAACQDAYAATYPDHAGYISAFPEGCLARIDGVPAATADDTSLIVPYYNLHKVLAGLIDIAKNVEDDEINKKALSVAEGFGEYLYNRMLQLTDKNRMLSTEYGGMNEALYELYNLTENEHYKTAAEYFDEVSLFEKLANGEDVLSGKHANTTIPKFIGAAKRYQLLSDDRFYNDLSQEDKDGLDMYLKAAENFWEIVTEDHTYITGGNSQSEHFHDANTQAEYADNVTCETCNTHNMLKLSRILFQVTGDKKYMDYYENTFINAILSSQNPETGMMMYFQPMAAGYFKVYNTPYEDFWCCTGTGIENFTKLGDTIYMPVTEFETNSAGAATQKALYVNMYWDSKYDNGKLAFDVDANFPTNETVTFTVNKNEDNEVVKLRVPDWVAGDVTVKKNGETITPTVDAGYMVLEDLAASDVITAHFPMKVVAYNLPDNTDMIAFKYGPVVLSCGLGTSNIDKEQGAGILVRAPQADTSINKIVIIEGDTLVSEWIADIENNFLRIETTEGGDVQFALRGTDRDELIYTPHYMQHTERYGIYMTFANKDSQVLQDMLMEEKKAAREEEASSDRITVFDENNSEISHNLQKSGYSTCGPHNGRTYRDAGSAATDWFSYDMKITPDAATQYVGITYNGGDSGRSFDIYINDEFFVTERITRDGVELTSDGFYVQEYQIPEKFLVGEDVKKDANGNPIITIKFQGNGSSFTGGVFGLSVYGLYDTDPALESLTFDKGTLDKEFDGEVTEYTLTVPAGTEEVNLTATTKKESALVYHGDILFDDNQPRKVVLTGDETVITLNSKAQDYETTKTYTITVVRATKAMDFVDVDKDEASCSWFYNEVKYMYENGIINGYDDTHYAPFENITRADFAVLLYRIAGEPDVTSENTFPDVPADAYFENAVIWASENNIVKGYDDGKFHPNDKISRQDMVVMLYRRAGEPVDGATGDCSNFTDVADIYPYAEDAIKWAVAQELVKGNPDGTLKPQSNITRAEAAVILYRYIV